MHLVPILISQINHCVDFYLPLHLSTAFDNVIFVGNLNVIDSFEDRRHLNCQMNIHNFIHPPRLES